MAQITIRKMLGRAYILFDPLNIFLYRLIAGYRLPIPPAENRMRVGSRSVWKFMAAGRRCYLPIKQAMQKFGGPSKGETRVLDLGAGVGRVMQYFLSDPVTLYTSDVDETAREYIAKNFPDVHAGSNNFAPPLGFKDSFFDVVYAVSVWTHLAPELQIPWLREVKRVLKPGGIALITTIGPYGYQRGTHLQAVSFGLNELVSTGFQYSEYPPHFKSPGTGNKYGATYQTPEYLRREWSKVMQVEDIQVGVIDNLNDLVVLRKVST
ncbi:MAG: class I SAM-dependent methyltransferase [Betaproteobacteria bacterium]|nr:class I SAM-dependent methyltransferase [Betaproteobacteria bacterium]